MTSSASGLRPNVSRLLREIGMSPFTSDAVVMRVQGFNQEEYVREVTMGGERMSRHADHSASGQIGNGLWPPPARRRADLQPRRGGPGQKHLIRT